MTSKDTCEKLMSVVNRFEFDIRLREMDYLQELQKAKDIKGSLLDSADIVNVVKAVSEMTTLLTETMQKSKDEFGGQDSAESQQMALKRKELVGLAVKILSVTITAIQFLHMVIVNNSRSHEKVIQEASSEKKEEE